MWQGVHSHNDANIKRKLRFGTDYPSTSLSIILDETVYACPMIDLGLYIFSSEAISSEVSFLP